VHFLLEEFKICIKSSLSTQSLCRIISPRVGVGVWFLGTESESWVLIFPTREKLMNSWTLYYSCIFVQWSSIKFWISINQYIYLYGLRIWTGFALAEVRPLQVLVLLLLLNVALFMVAVWAWSRLTMMCWSSRHARPRTQSSADSSSSTSSSRLQSSSPALSGSSGER